MKQKSKLLLEFLSMAVKLSKYNVIFIQALPVCRVATATPRGTPRVRPVWHVFDGKCIYFASDPGTVKLRHIAKNPKVSVVFDDYDRGNWGNIHGVRVQGTAKVMWGGEEYKYAHGLLKQKFPEYNTEAGGWKEGDVAIVGVTPQSYGEWTFGNWSTNSGA